MNEKELLQQLNQLNAFLASNPIGNRELMIAELTKTTKADSTPNINPLWWLVKDIDLIRLNIKNFGYVLAREMQKNLSLPHASSEPCNYALVSKATTQSDIESSWFSHWCRQLQITPIYHRKLWEFAFLLQVLHENGLLRQGMSGIGFGCGQEPLASYFASKGIAATVSDLEPVAVVGKGWAETGQHATGLDFAYHENLVEREVFDKYVRHRYIDMNSIPKMDEQFDFCWSICAMEHLGSIEQGLRFVERSLSVLKPGGIAVHTTEFNYLSDQETIDNWGTVLFRKQDFAKLKTVLASQGHQLIGPDFSVGVGVLDRFIDLPPYSIGEHGITHEQWNGINQNAHLKLAIDGFACTCFGIIVKKGAEK